MNNYINRWAVVAGALLLAAIVGVMAYNFGVSEGVEQSGKIVTAAPPGAYPHPYYGWHRPWGFGFFFVPLFFLAFWIFVVRGLFWRRWHHGQGGCATLEDWHRREHERMWNEPSGGTTSGTTSQP